MASVTTNYNKFGEIISYRFRACLGRDDLGIRNLQQRRYPRKGTDSRTSTARRL
jgi:hypothetical protein